MNRPSHFFSALIAFLLPVAAFSAAPEKGLPTGVQIQQRIDTLLKHRIRPEPLPVDLPNPFQVFTGGIRDAATESAGVKSVGKDEADAAAKAAAALPPPTNAEILVDCASRLKIGGIIIANGQRQILINGILRKEGDLVAAEGSNTTVQLRILRFVSGQVFLTYRNEETSVKF